MRSGSGTGCVQFLTKYGNFLMTSNGFHLTKMTLFQEIIWLFYPLIFKSNAGWLCLSQFSVTIIHTYLSFSSINFKRQAPRYLYVALFQSNFDCHTTKPLLKSNFVTLDDVLWQIRTRWWNVISVFLVFRWSLFFLFLNTSVFSSGKALWHR